MINKEHLPSGWNHDNLGSLCTRLTDGTHITPEYKDAGVIFISAKNVQNGRLDLRDHKYISEEEHKFLTKRCKPEAGDVMLSKSGSLGDAVVVPNFDFEFSIFESLALIKVKKGTISPEYLMQFLNSLIAKRYFWSIATGQAVKHLHLGDLRKMPIHHPSLSEQNAITELLSTWDEAIEKTERLIQAKEKRFKSLLRELISEPRKTQKGAKWENVKLEQVCKIASKEKLSSVDGHFLLTVKLHCLGIERNDRIAPTLTERGRPYYEHKSGDFLIGRQNFHNGGFGIIAPELDGGITSNAISCLIVNKSKLSKVFLWFQFANPNYYKKVGHVMDGTGQKELSDKQILKLKICLPDLETQNQIAEILSSAQHEIVLLKQLAEQYKAQKRGLMQKMLTGEWRVKPEIINQYMEV